MTTPWTAPSPAPTALSTKLRLSAETTGVPPRSHRRSGGGALSSSGEPQGVVVSGCVELAHAELARVGAGRGRGQAPFPPWSDELRLLPAERSTTAAASLFHQP